MPISAGVGFSNNPNSKLAGENACREAISEITNPNLLIVFSSVQHNQQEVIRAIGKTCPDCLLVGCSDAGQITMGSPSKGGVSVMALSSDKIKFIPGQGGEILDGGRKAGQKFAREVMAKTDEEIKVFLIFSDVLKGNGADIVRGIQDIAGQNAIIIGGAAGDDFLFKETFVYLNDKVLSSSLIGVGITGNFNFGIGVRHGWLPIGLPVEATKSEGALLKELGGKPAIKIYEEHFGKKAEELKDEPLATIAITYPLGMRIEGSDELLIRDPITVDDEGALNCAAEIPEGSKIQVMIGSKNEAIDAAKTAAINALNQLDGANPKAVIVFNCIARNKLLGRHSKDEIEVIRSILGDSVPLIGFYTYGEIAPLGGNLKKAFSCFHNETVVIFTLGE